MTCCNTPTENRAQTKSVSYFRPAVDVFESDAAFRIVADVPGASADAIDLDFDRNTLTLTARAPGRASESAKPIHAEYGVGDYRRVFRFDESVDSENTTAEFSAGVLTVNIPKTAAARKRRIHVSTESN